MKDQQEEARKTKCEGFLRKPVKKNELIVELMRFLPYYKVEQEVETGDKNGQKFISRETITRLPKLLDSLENKWTDEWKRISDIFVINDIEAFSIEIKKLGGQYDFKPLTDWGDKLLREIQSYDMENAPVTLEYFPQLIKTIAAVVEVESHDR
jgi:hypothetical protein